MRKHLIALAAAALLVPTLGVRLFHDDASAGVVGSPHDFSRTGTNYDALVAWPIAPGGACSGCHIPHRAPDNVGWPRDLSYYSRTHSGSTVGGGRLDLRDGTAGKPDFLRAATVPCYDCHDRHLDGLVETTSVPLLSDFVSGHKPQNILSGFRKVSTGTMTEYSPGPQAGKVIPGYHENSPPGSAANFGVNDPPPPLNQTGGHYFQADPRGTSGTGGDQGDKLPCSDCHDPHAWDPLGDWQAFFRRIWPTATVMSNLNTLSGGKALASSAMANDSTPTNKRATDVNGANGRYLCIACHGTFDSSTYPNRVRYSDINSEYDNSSQIVGLPDTVGEHFDDSKVACVSCHAHSSISASCTMCHGFPPSNSATSPYPNTFTPVPNPDNNDSHPRHYGGKSGQPRNALLSQGYLYTFDCKECHFGSSMGYDSSLGEHQNDRVSVVIAGRWTKAPNILTGKGTADNTNYFNRFQSYPPLQFPTRTGQLDNSNSVAGGGWGSGATYGGNTCRNVYCHSAGRATSTMLADCTVVFRPVSWNTGKKSCNDCHGFGTSSLPDNAGRVTLGMPSYPNGGINPPAGGGSNSHSAHVLVNGYECSVCHYNTVAGAGASRAIRTDVFPTLHVNAIRNVVFNGTSAAGSYDNTTKTCNVTCHGTDTPRWGGTLSGGCFACHSGTEAAEKPQLLPAVPNPVSLQEYAWSGHGRTGTAYTATGNPAAGFDNYTSGTAAECFYCHSASSSHTTKNPADPYRLGAGVDTAGQIGTVKGAFASNVDALCLACHGSDAERAGHPEAADGTNSINAVTHANGITGDKYSSWPVSPWKCVDCHDPHGDGVSGAERLAMVRASVNAPTSPADGSAGSDAYGSPLRTSGLTPVTFNSQAGMAAGSYATLPAKGQGICEICHTQTSLFGRNGSGNVGSHLGRTGRCTTCHVHKAGFKGLGGPDVGQYFDRLISPPGAENYFDNSSHPLVGLTDNTLGSLQFSGDNVTINCLGCHYTSGAPRTSHECLKCHFEEGKSPVTNHMDGVLQMARLTSDTSAPTSEFAIASLADFDAFCLQCHGSTSFTLGSRTPSTGRGTLLSAGDFAAGRHRAQTGVRATGCVYCHAVHGEGNALLARHNAANRAGAGPLPRSFGVFPLDNLDAVAPAYGRSGAQNVRYWARVDNTVNDSVHNVFADAADQNGFCNRSCHNLSYPKDHELLRDGTTGSYVLSPQMRKIHVIDGLQYTIDNLSAAGDAHIHLNSEIIPTDNMVDQYAAAAAVSGPSRYHYPNFPGSDPASFTAAANADYMNRFSKLPFFPDFTDGSRDFTNGYLNKGLVRYRFTCSTCHNPHGTSEPNANRGDPGWPDLRARRTNPNTLCIACH